MRTLAVLVAFALVPGLAIADGDKPAETKPVDAAPVVLEPAKPRAIAIYESNQDRRPVGERVCEPNGQGITECKPAPIAVQEPVFGGLPSAEPFAR